MTQTLARQTAAPSSPFVLALREELREGAMKRRARFALGDLEAEVCQGRDSVWCLIRREGRGGLALRAAWINGVDFTCRKVSCGAGETLRIEVASALGRHLLCFTGTAADLHRLRVTTRFTPASAMRLPFLPRDLYPLGRGDDPLRATGNVEAAQRGVNGGLVYFRLDEPAFGSVLYVQNLTALNPYFLATGTKPEAVVGGEWPELGYQPPTPGSRQVEEGRTLAAGEDYVLSDAILVLRDWAGNNEQEMARQFLQMLGAAYIVLDRPTVEYRDWAWRAERTLAHLEGARRATERHEGDLYVMPYVEGEVPDVMVQLSVVQALHEYGTWREEPVRLAATLMKGVARFFDPKIKTFRRFLPDVDPEQKDNDEVDSWYLYHPLLNLGRLALRGNVEARDLLLKAIDYGIEAARHFDYAWPIKYNIGDFSVIEKTRGDERFGQTDVGGIYAYVMLQCFELTGEKRYVQEARKAIDKAKELRFDLLYQANLTTWGAVACLRLWRITDDASYLAQSYAYLAGFFHNTILWESEIDAAQHYNVFLGASALHDGPYMAMYECFESFAGFEEYLAQAGSNLEPAVRMLVSEYCKYALDRAWFYFPDALPKDLLHQGKHQSGTVDRALSFPLEDLYADGQAPGQIGQEIYGCGGAFVFATRSHHAVENAPFQLYCDHFIRAHERTGERALSLMLDGGEACVANLSLVRRKRRKLTPASVVTAGGDAIRPHTVTDDRVDFHVPSNGRVILTWE